jgi:hypothetical protein
MHLSARPEYDVYIVKPKPFRAGIRQGLVFWVLFQI